MPWTRDRHTDNVNIRFAALQTVQDSLEETYDPWAQQIMRNTGDDFFETSTPVLVISQYGQNAEICREGMEDNLGDFVGNLNWDAVFQFSFALASTIRCATSASLRLTPTHPVNC